MSKDTFYFSHDYNTRNDIKIKDMIVEHGMLGYGVFWSIIEDLYNNANALPTKYKTIAYDLRVDESLVKSIINDFDLFVFEDDVFGSLSVERRLDERALKSKNASKAAAARWDKEKRKALAMQAHADALQEECEPNAIKESKGKKNKEKKDICVNGVFYDVKSAFELFWDNYQNKKGKEDCGKIFLKLDKSILELVINKAKIYGDSFLSKPEGREYQKLPKTWLNGKNWEDEITQPIQAKPKYNPLIAL